MSLFLILLAAAGTPATATDFLNGWTLTYCWAQRHAAEKKEAFYSAIAKSTEKPDNRWPDIDAYEQLAKTAAKRLASKSQRLPPENCGDEQFVARLGCVDALCGAAECEDELGADGVRAVKAENERDRVIGAFPCPVSEEVEAGTRLAREAKDPNYAKARYLELCMPDVLRERIKHATKTTKASAAQRATWNKAVAAAEGIAARAVEDLKTHDLHDFQGCANAFVNSPASAVDCAYREVPLDHEISRSAASTWCKFGPSLDLSNSVREGPR